MNIQKLRTISSKNGVHTTFSSFHPFKFPQTWFLLCTLKGSLYINYKCKEKVQFCKRAKNLWCDTFKQIYLKTRCTCPLTTCKHVVQFVVFTKVTNHYHLQMCCNGMHDVWWWEEVFEVWECTNIFSQFSSSSSSSSWSMAWWHKCTLETLQVKESNLETLIPNCWYSLVESM